VHTFKLGHCYFSNRATRGQNKPVASRVWGSQTRCCRDALKTAAGSARAFQKWNLTCWPTLMHRISMIQLGPLFSQGIVETRTAKVGGFFQNQQENSYGVTR